MQKPFSRFLIDFMSQTWNVAGLQQCMPVQQKFLIQRERERERETERKRVAQAFDQASPRARSESPGAVMGGKLLKVVALLIWGSYGQPPPPPPDGEEVDEIMQVFLERSAGGHLPFVPIPEDELDPFADLDPLAPGGATHQFVQPDYRTGEDQFEETTGGASSSHDPPSRLPFHGPNLFLTKKPRLALHGRQRRGRGTLWGRSTRGAKSS